MNNHIKKQLVFNASLAQEPYVVLDGNTIIHFSMVNLPSDPSMRVEDNEIILILNPGNDMDSEYNIVNTLCIADYPWEEYWDNDFQMKVYQNDYELTPTRVSFSSNNWYAFLLDPSLTTTVRITISLDLLNDTGGFDIHPCRKDKYGSIYPVDSDILLSLLNKSVIGSALKLEAEYSVYYFSKK